MKSGCPAATELGVGPSLHQRPHDLHVAVDDGQHHLECLLLFAFPVVDTGVTLDDQAEGRLVGRITGIAIAEIAAGVVIFDGTQVSTKSTLPMLRRSCR